LYSEIGRWLKFEEASTKEKDEELVEIDQSLSLGKRTIALEEVVVSKKTPFSDNKYQITPEIEARAITDLDIKRTPSVVNYIRRLGFIMRADRGNFKAYINYHPGLKRVPIIINGMFALPGEIIGMPLSSVRNLTYNKSRNGPFISIQLNPNYVAPENRNKFIKFAIKNGYARPQTYFTANYPDYTTSVFKNFGALDWHANLKIGSEIPTSIMIPIKGQRTINLFVEGMNSKGGLFIQNETIATTEDY